MAKAALYAAGAVAVLAAIGYLAAKRAGVLPNADTFNPLSENNLAYRGANAVYQAVSGNTVDTIGTALASGYSDRIGREATAPVYISGGRVVPVPVEQQLYANPSNPDYLSPFMYGA